MIKKAKFLSPEGGDSSGDSSCGRYGVVPEVCPNVEDANPCAISAVCAISPGQEAAA